MLWIYLLTFILSLCITVITERRLIPFLRSRAAQPIYEGGPAWHSTKKGTPTMGGVGFILGIAVPLIIFTITLIGAEDFGEGYTLIFCLGYALLNALVGVFDDLKKLKRKENAGLSPTEKLALQFIISGAYLWIWATVFGVNTELRLGFWDIDLGFFYYPVILLVMVGMTNFANLTDGIDGLASSVSLAIGAGIFFITAYSSASVSTAACALVGGAFGFLFFNANPAKIFMGDTGSLFLGALAVAALYSASVPLLILPLGIVYLIEGTSVVIQVLIFKLTGKRVFKMAPLHHHLEKSGWSETKICMAALVLTLVSSLLVYFFKGAFP